MFRIVARHEWRLLLADRAAVVVLGVFVVFSGYAAWTGADAARARQTAVQQVVAAEAVRRAEQRRELEAPKGTEPPAAAFPWSPRDVATLPPSALGALAIGQSDVLVGTANVGLFRTPADMFPAYSTENPATLAGGRFDLAFLLAYVLPLLVLGLSFNMLTAEREASTLPLVLSHPVGVGTLLAGKVVVRGLLVAAVVVPVTLLGVLLGRPVPLGAGDGWLLFGLVGLILGYLAVWLGVAAFVNVRSRSSAVNALALGSVWLATVVVAPALLNLALSVWYPAPSRPMLVNQERATLVDAQRRGTEVLGNYYQQHPELLPVASRDGADPIDNSTRAYWTVVQQAFAETTPALHAHAAALEEQRRFSERFRYLSPAVVLVDGLSEIAGTGPSRYADFRDQAVDALSNWVAATSPHLLRGQLFTASEVVALPTFAFREASRAEYVSRLSPIAAGLVVPAVVIWVATLWRVRRTRGV